MKARVTTASATLPRKNCAAAPPNFMVWLRFIRRPSRLCPAGQIRASCTKNRQSVTVSTRPLDAVPGLFGADAVRCGGSGVGHESRDYKPSYDSPNPFDIEHVSPYN